MQLMQQLLAALLNEAAFDTDYNNATLTVSGNFITDAINELDTGSDTVILLTLAGHIAFINEGSGFGEQQLPAGFNLGAVNPKGAKAMADKAAWDLWT